MTLKTSDLGAPDMALPIVHELLQMHTYARPEGSVTQSIFCDRYIKPLPNAYKDEAGNWIVKVGESRVLWSCHTDTVHSKEGRTKLTYGGAILSLSTKEEDANCLGADCTVGVWLMRNMILRGVPGLYVFHAGEECGGHGSIHIAQKTPELLAEIDFAIALDRKGETSVVTHQWGGRCASDAFAHIFAAQFDAISYQPDDGGTFTDTANYTHLVAECTNISVGYYGQHTRNEILDVGFAITLLEQICKVDESKFVKERDPKSVSSYGYSDSRHRYDDWWSRSSTSRASRYVDTSILDTGKDFMEQMTDIAFECPEVLETLFQDYGIDERVLQEYVRLHNEKMMGH